MRVRKLSTVVVAALAALTGIAHAQQPSSSDKSARAFPTKPIRFVVPFSPGGSTDTLARLIAHKMSEGWGQSMVIDNRSGAGGTIGTALVAKATPDGYTLLATSSSFAITAALNNNLPYDPLKDFVGVTQIGYSKTVLVVTPSLGVKTLKEFIVLARARPGKIFFASAGVGTSTYMNGERFRLAAGIKAVHVGFKGAADATLEVVAGRVHYVVSGLLTTLPHIQDGKLIALGMTTPVRTPVLPDVPAIAEILPGYKRDGSHVMLAPAGTPRHILNQVSNEVRRIFELPDVKERLKNYDYMLSPTTPEELDKIIRADIETFSEVVRLAGLRGK